MSRLAYILIIACLFTISQQRTKDEWKTRTIYQVLTDRFERSDGARPGCDLHYYCGGNYQGLIKKLDYIKGMGFDAIWISPVVDNYPQGYHGYWARNMYGVNTNFGSAADLKSLVQAAHAKDIWVMVDVVGNHMGNTDQNYGQNHPFTDSSHYHSYCVIQGSDFTNHNMYNLQFCRLAGLADLNSENSFVISEMSKWIKFLITEYGFDGIRVDTVIEVPTPFWKTFTQAAGVFSIGEAFDGDYKLVSSFVGPLDSVLNYPLFFTLRDVFLHYKDMNEIKNYYSNWGNFVGVHNLPYMGNFNDNHDNARFLSGNVGATENLDHIKLPEELKTTVKQMQFRALTGFVLTSIGIPIVYYGSEQYFGGGDDPYNREIMWNNFDTNSEMYVFIKTINAARKATNAEGQPHVERYVDTEVYAFSRGHLFAAFSSRFDRQVRKSITYHPYTEGTTICNIFYPTTDCLKITGGKFDLYLNYGEVKIFVPK